MRLARKRIPSITFINYYKEMPGLKSTNAFTRWLYCEKRWSGNIIYIGIKHWCLEFDFRKNWLNDMKAGE